MVVFSDLARASQRDHGTALGSRHATYGQGSAGDRRSIRAGLDRSCRSRGALGDAWRDDRQVRAIQGPAGRLIPDGGDLSRRLGRTGQGDRGFRYRRGPPHWPLQLRGRCEEAFVRIGRRMSEPVIGARIDSATWQRAIRRCETLLDTQARQVLLHGDLHLGNVLDGGPSRGLVAIDPKACIGDPCFHAVDYVVAGAGQEGVESRCQRVAIACGLDGDRLYAWSQVIAPMVAIARLTYGGPASVTNCSPWPAEPARASARAADSPALDGQ
nr:aminoglycoside phosphotransferase family protein [Amycolatopsis sp. FDAARGOS 1241]